MGRPKLDRTNFQITLDNTIRAKLREHCSVTGQSMGAVVDKALILYFEQIGQPVPAHAAA